VGANRRTRFGEYTVEEERKGIKRGRGSRDLKFMRSKRARSVEESYTH